MQMNIHGVTKIELFKKVQHNDEDPAMMVTYRVLKISGREEIELCLFTDGDKEKGLTALEALAIHYNEDRSR